MKQLCDLFKEKEELLRSDPDFEEVRKEDLDAVEAFRKGLGLSTGKAKKPKPAPSTPVDMEEESDDEDDNSLTTPRNRSSKYRMSHASSVRSILSNNLSPLLEDDIESSDDDVPIETLKKRRLSMTPPQTQGEATIKEASDEDNDSKSSASSMEEPAKTKKRKVSASTPLTQAEETIKEGSDEDDASKSSLSTTLS